MESLDRAFENVCELDLVFHFDEVSNFAYDISFMDKLCFRFITFLLRSFKVVSFSKRTWKKLIKLVGIHSYLAQIIMSFHSSQSKRRLVRGKIPTHHPIPSPSEEEGLHLVGQI